MTDTEKDAANRFQTSMPSLRQAKNGLKKTKRSLLTVKKRMLSDTVPTSGQRLKELSNVWRP